MVKVVNIINSLNLYAGLLLYLMYILRLLRRNIAIRDILLFWDIELHSIVL